MRYAFVSHLWTKDIDLCSGPKVSRQFQFTHGISICWRQFQFTHGNFSLLAAISFYSQQFQFYFTAIFRFPHHLSTTAADSGHQKSKNAKLKVDI